MIFKLFRRDSDPAELSTSQLQDLAWSRMPREQKVKAVAYLREQVGNDEIQRLVKKANDAHATFFHFDEGMEIRNLLRDVIPDRELPPLPEWYGPDVEVGNWDDYYVQVIEAASGSREL